MQTTSRTGLTDRSLVALAFVNFFLAEDRDALGRFLHGFLATNGWSPMALGVIATLGGLIGMVAMPLFGAWVDAYTANVISVILVTAAALWTLASLGNAAVFSGQSATEIVGASVGSALMAQTLEHVGERRFSHQVARNEFWNHLGNVVSLAGIYAETVAFGLNGVIGLMVVRAIAAVVAALAIDPSKINHDVVRCQMLDDGAPRPSGYSVLVGSKGSSCLGAHS